MPRTDTTNHWRRATIKAAVITALILAGGLGVHFLIRALIAMHS